MPMHIFSLPINSRKVILYSEGKRIRTQLILNSLYSNRNGLLGEHLQRHAACAGKVC